MNVKENTILSEKDIKSNIVGKKYITVELSKEERNCLYGLEEVFDCGFTLSSDCEDLTKLPPVITMNVTLNCSLIDNFTFKLEKETFFDNDEVVLYGEDDDECIERVGKDFDLRPTFLAILYTMIPIAYSKVDKFNGTKINGFEVLPESEYLKKKKEEEKKANPFSELDENDF